MMLRTHTASLGLAIHFKTESYYSLLLSRLINEGDSFCLKKQQEKLD